MARVVPVFFAKRPAHSECARAGPHARRQPFFAAGLPYQLLPPRAMVTDAGEDVQCAEGVHCAWSGVRLLLSSRRPSSRIRDSTLATYGGGGGDDGDVRSARRFKNDREPYFHTKAARAPRVAKPNVLNASCTLFCVSILPLTIEPSSGVMRRAYVVEPTMKLAEGNVPYCS